jgi:hypothetical protein
VAPGGGGLRRRQTLRLGQQGGDGRALAQQDLARPRDGADGVRYYFVR